MQKIKNIVLSITLSNTGLIEGSKNLLTQFWWSLQQGALKQ